MMGMKKTMLYLKTYIDLLTKGYAVCIYVASIFESGNIQVRLFISKRCIETLKEIPIPRLEVFGNSLVPRLVNTVKTALEKYRIDFDIH